MAPARIVMRSFRPRGAARFRFRARFEEFAYANISFYDPEARDILFHLSFRRAAGLAVCNERGASPESWRRELRCAIELTPAGGWVELVFEANRLTVTMDGKPLFRLPDRLRPGRFRGLQGIAWVDQQGGVCAASIDAEPVVGPGPYDPRIDDRLDWRARLAVPRGQRAGLRLLAADGAVTLPVVARDIEGEAPGLADLWVSVPGWLWSRVPQGAPLELAPVGSDGQALAPPMQLTRAALADRAGTYLSAAGSDDPALILHLVEHLRNARAWDLMPAQDRWAFARRAAAHGVELEPAETGPRAPAQRPADTAAEAEIGAIRAAHAALAKILAGADPRTAPVLPPRGALTIEAERRMLLWLTEAACCADAVDALVQAAGRDPFRRVRPTGLVWPDSGALPFLWRQGRTAEAARWLARIAQSDDPGVQTPAIGWTVRQALAGSGRRARSVRDAMAQAFVDYLQSREKDYWGRTACVEITRAAAALVAAAPALPPDLAKRASRAAVSACGLSPTFWRQLHAALEDRPVPAPIRAAGAAFDALLEAVDRGPPGAVAAALDRLAPFELAGLPQARRELLGPAGIALPSGTAVTAARLRTGADNPGMAALRHLAFPGQAGDPELAALAAKAMPLAYNQIPALPQAAAQRAVVATARATIAAALTGTPPGGDRLQALARDCLALTGGADGDIGLAIGFATVDALCRAEADAAATVLGQGLIPACAVGAAGPGLHHALSALAATAAQGSRMAGTLLAGLPTALQPGPPAIPQRWRADARGALCDAVVAIITCEPNLATRVAAIRQSWVPMLAPLGVRHVFVTGNGDGSRDGDLLRLDAPDDYAGLPLKTLALLRWFRDQTRFGYLIKVDDDCFLNAPAFFADLNYRKFDFHGRRLLRIPGQLDRAWHRDKASAGGASRVFDRSPEPSVYADGGTGYTLSRRAVSAALDAAASPDGQRLIAVSALEDKLLGDLLSLQGITAQSEGYHVSVRRRSSAGLPPVSRWMAGFDPGRAAPVKLVHLDTHEGMHRLVDGLNESGLGPSKIWPGYSPPVLGYASNALEYIGAPQALDAARAADVAVVSCLRNEMFMLPHFLAHYRALGAKAFLIADNLSDDGTLEYLAAQPDVALFSVDTDYRDAAYGVAWQQALLAAFRVNRWSVVADADELLVWSDRARDSLPALLASDAFRDADAARVFMLDMYPKGPLAAADFADGPFAQAGFCDREPFDAGWLGRGPFSNAATWTSALRHRLIPNAPPHLYVAQKIAVLRYRPWMRLCAGLHYIADARLARRELIFAHFKYNAAFHRKIRAEVARGQHFDDAIEYRRYQALLGEGRDVIYDSALSVPWSEAPFVRARLSASRDAVSA
jgi:hypothetical protein